MSRATQDRQPTHRLYCVKGEGKAARWIEIGAAWSNRDGGGFSLKLDSIPLDGNVVMRVPKTERETQQPSS